MASKSNSQSVKKIISNLLLEITSKKNWYSKVFNENIVHNWKHEFLTQSPDTGDLFDMVIRFAQATAQGCIHKDDCPWTENDNLCDQCKKEMRKKIENNPAEFQCEPDELSVMFEDDNWIYEFDFHCNHPRCSCVPPDFELIKYIRYNPLGVLDENLHKELKEHIQKMLDTEPIDWHPGSNEQVRDLVHPSMYCYVKGVSQLNDGTIEEPCEEDQRYQWLPSEFNVSEDGQVKISSYINNLNSQKYPQMIPLLEKSFQAFIPSLEVVLKKSLRNKDLQVITKIGTIYLDPSKPTYPGGSWHIEGMPYEHIVATCIHYLDINGISESFLEFRKPVIFNEGYPEPSYPQGDANFTTHHYGIEQDSHFQGQMNRYLGLVKCHEGASIVFPNTLQHKVREFSLIGQKGIRTILVFFVIDPGKKIISTSNVNPQQTVFTREQALYHRERLMFHRKYFVNIINKEIFERPYSLCEH